MRRGVCCRRSGSIFSIYAFVFWRSEREFVIFFIGVVVDDDDDDDDTNLFYDYINLDEDVSAGYCCCSPRFDANSELSTREIRKPQRNRRIFSIRLTSFAASYPCIRRRAPVCGTADDVRF